MNNFNSLYAQLATDINALSSVKGFIKGSNEHCKAVYTLVSTFASLLSKTQSEKLGAGIADIAGVDDSSIEIDNFSHMLSWEESAIMIMLMASKDLCKELVELNDDVKLDIDDMNISKWEQTELNSWSWFARELWKQSVKQEIEHFFVLKIKHSDTTEIETYGLYKTSNIKDAKLACYALAQFFVGGTACSDEMAFVSEFEGRFTKQYPLEPMLVSKDEYNIYSKLGLRKYDQLSDIPCDKEEVKNLWAYEFDEDLDENKEINF